MLLHLVAAGTRMPGWVNAGYRDYADRLQGADYRMALTEIPLGKRSGDEVAGPSVQTIFARRVTVRG